MVSYSTDNWQAQLEEVLALKAIYAEDFSVTHLPGHQQPISSSSSDGGGGGASSSSSSPPASSEPQDLEQQLEALLGSEPPQPCDAQGRLLTCEAVVAVDLPCGALQLMIDAAAAPDAAGAGQQRPPQQQQQPSSNGDTRSSQGQLPFGPPVKHLPPVRVLLQLPHSYPSSAHAPPLLQLQATWLSAHHQQQLQQQLLELWQEQGPGPVCFSLLEHIKAAALPALGITEQLVLTAPHHHQQQQQAGSNNANATSSSVSGRSAAGAVAAAGSTSSSKQLSAAAAPFTPPSGAAEQGASNGPRHTPSRQQQQSQSQHQGQQQQQHKQEKQQKQQQQWQPKQRQPPQLQQQQQQDGTSPAPPVDQLALQLLRYSAAREQQDFNNGTWTCGICFDAVPGSSCLRLPDCHHFYCTTCLASAALAQLDEGAVDNMRCPEPSCRKVLPPYVLKQLLGGEQYDRWEALSLSRALDRMSDVAYCPRCEAVCVEDGDHCAQCERCLYVFCTFCSDSYHPGTECLDPHERLRVLERRRRATSAADRHRELDLVNQAMNLKYIKGAAKACPGCGMATIKNEGCMRMTCASCRSFWCWRCLQVIDGYDHFRADGCQLFDQAEIDRWHALLLENERAQEVEQGHRALLQGRHAAAGGGGGGVRFVRCPVCGQENLREGRNNLLRCWSCSSYSCVSCRAWLRGKSPGQHYMTGRCKQHGD